ncbi:MAG TPA: hypothetical protein VIH68_03755, partial [Bacteroidota bacterium]
MRMAKFMPLLAVLVVPLIARGDPTDRKDQCFTCHQAIEDPVAAMYVTDVHFKKNISCAECHGGNSQSEDMDEAMGVQAGFVKNLQGDEISKRCARCHADAGYMKTMNSALRTDQYSKYVESVHGRTDAGGGERLVQCITCHGVHNIIPVRNPQSRVSSVHVVQTCVRCHGDAAFMRKYNPGLPIDQFEKYKTSEHGRRWLRGDRKVAQCVS